MIIFLLYFFVLAKIMKQYSQYVKLNVIMGFSRREMQPPPPHHNDRNEILHPQLFFLEFKQYNRFQEKSNLEFQNKIRK